MRILKVVLPLLILAVAATAAAVMIRSRRPVERQETPAPAPLVRVRTVATVNRPLSVVAHGTVRPRTEATLAAQVAGEVITTAQGFVAGGFFDAGDELVRLDARDHELALERARADVAQAELRQAQEEAEARLAAEEWSELGAGGVPDPLVLREPQLASLRAVRAAAEAAVGLAELAVARTVIRAPYAGRIRAVHVGRGQFVTPGTPLATVHPTDYAEVRLPVPDADLAFLDLALTPARDHHRPEVTLRADFAGSERTWQGRIVRTEGELDPRTRMLTLIARVDDPYARSGAAAQRTPLPVGLFVEATIAGRQAVDVVVLPRRALRRTADGDRQVLVVDQDERLRMRTVDVLRLEGDEAIVSAGLETGDRVVVSNLAAAIDGMAVRTVADDPAEARR